MKKVIHVFVNFLIISIISVSTQYCTTPGSDAPFEPIREMYNRNIHDRLFDFDWKFQKGPTEGAEMPAYDDSNWRLLDLPHDWSIEDLNLKSEDYNDTSPVPEGPFSPNSPGDISTGYVLGGTGWYRKTFELNPMDFGRIVKITFDGIYMNADIWINGQHLGNHPYGYTAFSFDITPYLKFDGTKNVLSVRVVNEGRNSRWYSGSGIYRHVWLSITDPMHLNRWGLFVTTPEVDSNAATIHIDALITNYYDHARDFTLQTRIIDPSGNKVIEKTQSHSLNSGISNTISESLKVENPLLWSIDNPQLYLAELSVLLDGKHVDQLTTTFGIRSIEFSIENGFRLNGETILLKGGNMHHDNGPLGAATIDRAEYRRVELMKSYGYNAIRTSHNPPSRQFLDACDKSGILVIDEAFDQWQRPKNPNDYNLYFYQWWEKDIEAMVLRDRNHPAVIIWSIGNEINERADSTGLYLTKVLSEKVKSLDPTRPVTAAICGFWEFPGRPWEDSAPAFELLELDGYNYKWDKYESDHLLYPERIIVGTESVAMEVYENWKLVEDKPWVIGDFLWTSMDYLGEAGIGNALLEGEEKTWPWFNAYCGDIDLLGFKKPQSYYRDVVWGISNLEIAVHKPIPKGKKEIISFWGWPDEQQSWNWAGFENKLMNVSVYTRCDSVVLELNDNRVGSVVMYDTMKYKAEFKVMYELGTLKAAGYLNGSIAEEKTLKTTGQPVGINVQVDRPEIEADRNELAYITAEIVDSNGVRVTDASNHVSFEIQGVGELAGIGNGNPIDVKSFQKPNCSAFNGRCLIIIRPTGEVGEIKVTAKSISLNEDQISIKVDELY